MEYAIIRVGNKQHRVRDGETLVVDRVHVEEGQTFSPDVLLGEAKVTVTVLGHGRGPKIRIGKYRKRTGYKRHNGFRAAVTEIEVSFGGAKRAAAKTAATKAEAAPKEAAAESVAAATPGLPDGYSDLKVGEVAAAAAGWGKEQLEAALAYEQANAARKGATAALETALAKEGDA
ncbi:MAG: bL21 family ribosomal protein [Actinomycetes bacterium]